MEKSRVLIVDDEPRNVELIRSILNSQNCYIVDQATNGEEALKQIKGKNYDVLVTDWLMPKMNGAELIKQVRNQLTVHPFIMMISAIKSSQAKKDILEIGADEYISKPFRMKDFLVILQDGLARRAQPLPKIQKIKIPQRTFTPPFVAVVIASSTGGFEALIHLFSHPLSDKAAFFVAQHAPEETLRNMARIIKNLTKLKVSLARESQRINPGNVYIAPGDRHLCIDPKSLTISLNQDPKENFVRPSADPLFRSAALAFGKSTLGIVLTGLGVDGTHGAAHIKAAGGEVIAQEPESATASSMPNSVVISGLATEVVKLSEINSKIESQILALSSNLTV